MSFSRSRKPHFVSSPTHTILASPYSPLVDEAYPGASHKFEDHDYAPSVVRWKIESLSLMFSLLALCITTGFTVWHCRPIINSSASAINSGANVVQTGVGITRQAASVVFDVSTLATDLVRGTGRAWCQTVGLGCVPSIHTTPTSPPAPPRDRAVLSGQRTRTFTTTSVLQGAALVGDINKLSEISIDMQDWQPIRLLGNELADLLKSREGRVWSLALLRIGDMQRALSGQKSDAWHHTVSLLGNVVDSYNIAMKRSKLAKPGLVASWVPLFRLIVDNYHLNINSEVTTFVLQTSHQIQAASSLAVRMMEEGDSIYDTSRDVLEGTALLSRRLSVESEIPSVWNSLCSKVGDFQLAGLNCKNQSKDRLHSLLKRVSERLEETVTTAHEVATVSKKLSEDLIAFGRSFNDTVGVTSSITGFRLLGDGPTQLAMLQEGISALQSSLHDIIAY